MARGKPFQKGNPGKPKGAGNKVTQNIRDKFEQLLDGVGVEQMVDDLKKMEPMQRMNTIMGLAEYLVPKLARTDVKHDVEEGITELTLNIKRNRDES